MNLFFVDCPHCVALFDVRSLLAEDDGIAATLNEIQTYLQQRAI